MASIMISSFSMISVNAGMGSWVKNETGSVITCWGVWNDKDTSELVY